MATISDQVAAARSALGRVMQMANLGVETYGEQWTEGDMEADRNLIEATLSLALAAPHQEGMTSALVTMSEPKLCAWLLARMRGTRVDPPVEPSRLETPADHVKAIYQQARDVEFRTRLERATVGALEVAARGDLQVCGPDSRAAGDLAWLADRIGLRTAAPVLQGIAQRGVFGGHAKGLDPEAERLVLFALAGLQEKGRLYGSWLMVWRSEHSRLWPVATAGLRLSDSKLALAILPEAIERGAHHPDFPLGEVLWAFATFENYAGATLAEALKGLPLAARRRCRAALKSVGATAKELNAVVPILERA